MAAIIETANTSELGELERIIERGLQNFRKVGAALRRIQDYRLYPDKNFAGYCRRRWGFGRARAYQLMAASRLIKKLSTMVDKNENVGRSLTLRNERQLREIAKASQDVQSRMIAKLQGPCTAAQLTRLRIMLQAGDPQSDELAEELLAAREAVERAEKLSALDQLCKKLREEHAELSNGQAADDALDVYLQQIKADKTEGEVTVQETEGERAWRLLQLLISQADSIHLDIDHDPDGPCIMLRQFGDRIRPELRYVMRAGLMGVLSAAAGEEELRRCPRCTQVKPIEAFAASTSQCRQCERRRVKTFTALSAD